MADPIVPKNASKKRVEAVTGNEKSEREKRYEIRGPVG